MSQNEVRPLRRRRLSLSVRVTIWLVVTAILPLLITVSISEYLTRPDLIDKANTQMENDARTRVRLIDTYFQERMFDAQTLTQVPSAQTFMALPPQTRELNPFTYEEQAKHAEYALGAGMFRDKNYVSWTLFNKQGQLALSYPQPKPQPHGKTLVPPQYLQEVQSGKTFISDVYYDTKTQKAMVDIYSPMISLQPRMYLGFIRATLSLDNIWSIVKDDQGNNGDGSYAFLLDENGVRIGDTDTHRLFQSVGQLSSDVQQRIQDEALYGGSSMVSVKAEPAFNTAVHSKDQSMRFEAEPAGLNEQYQVVERATATVPWHYFVLSPVNTVTAVANQQLFITGGTAFVVSLLVALIGLLVGSNLGRPILSSVEALRGSSEALTMLATKQQDAASEQQWVVDSSQVGMQSVQYYTEAMAVAARELSKTGTDLAEQWGQIDTYVARRALERIVKAAQYIENAAHYQEVSTQKLATALKVATQVTEQLVAGTTSATDAATQLESVVEQLQHVVGK